MQVVFDNWKFREILKSIVEKKELNGDRISSKQQLYMRIGEALHICLERSAYRRDDSKNLPVGVHDDRFVWRLKRPEENSPDIKPIKFISAYHTKEYCLVIETTADRKEYDFHRVLEYYPECSFDSFTIKEYSIIFEHGPEISYLDFHQYIQCKFIQLMG